MTLPDERVQALKGIPDVAMAILLETAIAMKRWRSGKPIKRVSVSPELIEALRFCLRHYPTSVEIDRGWTDPWK